MQRLVKFLKQERVPIAWESKHYKTHYGADLPSVRPKGSVMEKKTEKKTEKKKKSKKRTGNKRPRSIPIAPPLVTPPSEEEKKADDVLKDMTEPRTVKVPLNSDEIAEHKRGNTLGTPVIDSRETKDSIIADFGDGETKKMGMVGSSVLSLGPYSTFPYKLVTTRAMEVGDEFLIGDVAHARDAVKMAAFPVHDKTGKLDLKSTINMIENYNLRVNEMCKYREIYTWTENGHGRALMCPTFMVDRPMAAGEEVFRHSRAGWWLFNLMMTYPTQWIVDHKNVIAGLVQLCCKGETPFDPDVNDNGRSSNFSESYRCWDIFQVFGHDLQNLDEFLASRPADMVRSVPGYTDEKSHDPNVGNPHPPPVNHPPATIQGETKRTEPFVESKIDGIDFLKGLIGGGVDILRSALPLQAVPPTVTGFQGVPPSSSTVIGFQGIPPSPSLINQHQQPLLAGLTLLPDDVTDNMTTSPPLKEVALPSSLKTSLKTQHSSKSKLARQSRFKVAFGSLGPSHAVQFVDDVDLLSLS